VQEEIFSKTEVPRYDAVIAKSNAAQGDFLQVLPFILVFEEVA
jgi:hypothetical protein